jgi:hypothetical protein
MSSIVGILVEPRKCIQVFYLIENFFNVLKKEHKLYFFCGKGYASYYKNRLKSKDFFNKINFYELDTKNLTVSGYNNLLKSLNFWNKITEDYALVIQTDGCLCKKSNFKLQDFIQYDYIGGYAKQNWWRKETKELDKELNLENNLYQCYNGGFSFRKISSIKKVLTTFPPKKYIFFNKNQAFEHYAEDLYFVVGLLKLELKVGNDKFATNFCTHTSYVNNTFCVHKLNHYNKKDAQRFFNYCGYYKKFLKIDYI